MLEKKKILKILIVIFMLVTIIVLIHEIIKDTNAKYASEAMTSRDVDVAFVITDSSIKEGNILLEDIHPSETPYKYNFSISNNYEGKRAETQMEYTIRLIASTNIPLEYDLYKKGKEPSEPNIKCTKKENIIQDEYGTQYKEIIFEPKTNNFNLGILENEIDLMELQVKFPTTVVSNYKYADLISNLRIEIEARQIIDETTEKDEPKI